MLANARTTAASGLEAATSQLGEAVRLLPEMATQLGLLALGLSRTAARVDGSERRDEDREPAAPASAHSIAELADRLRDLGASAAAVW
jgi:hypothetical protein